MNTLSHTAQVDLHPRVKTFFHCRPAWRRIVLGCLGAFAAITSPRAADTNNPLVDDERAYVSIARELRECMARRERFTALPANVTDVICPPQGPPLFLVPSQDRRQLSERPSDYVQDEGSFRMVRYGSVLGVSANELVLLGGQLDDPRGAALRELAIVSTTTVRHLRSPYYLGVT